MLNSPPQTTAQLLMVRPAAFGFNAETAANNAFQTNDLTRTREQIEVQARAEFDNFVHLLRGKGVQIMVVEDTPLPVKTDAVFPNNWVSFHADGTVVTYPMFSPIRRHERREDIMETLKKQFDITNEIHLEAAEAENHFLEGTGSMVFDRTNGICYACLSPRTDFILLEKFCNLLNFKRVAFHATDAKGQDIYHTNVMMALGETFVVVCLDAVRDEAEKWLLKNLFEKTQKDIIEISYAQMRQFAGNMLQVRSTEGGTFLVMSASAFHALTPQQIAHIEKHTQILHSDLGVIETYGGGSARCMMAEVFLPLKN
jgi:hypothetical protein